MNENDFYEVDGCFDFIPVTIDGICYDGVAVTVSDDKRDYKLVVKEVYRLPKPQEQQIELLKRLEAENDTEV